MNLISLLGQCAAGCQRATYLTEALARSRSKLRQVIDDIPDGPALLRTLDDALVEQARGDGDGATAAEACLTSLRLAFAALGRTDWASSVDAMLGKSRRFAAVARAVVEHGARGHGEW